MIVDLILVGNDSASVLLFLEERQGKKSRNDIARKGNEKVTIKKNRIKTWS